jgi:photosystem II stability/assembly factor-like uncharacterized protein
MTAFLLRWLARLSPWLFIASLGYAALFVQLKADQSVLGQPLVEKRDRFFGAAVFGEDVWFVGGEGVLLESDDAGASWTRQQLPDAVNLQSTAVSPDGIRIVVGNQAKVFVGQVGSNTWKSYVLPLPDYADKLNYVQFIDGAFWVVGEVGAVYRLSADGITWKNYGLGEDFSINGIARSPDGTFWLAAEYGNLFRSKDNGSSWARISLSEESLRSIYFQNGEGVAVGNGGQVYVSKNDDGTWVKQPAFTSEHLFDVTWHDGRWIVVGDQGQMFSAANPIGEWTQITPVGMSKSFFMAAVSVESGVLLAGKTLGLVDNNNRWVNWPLEE